MKQAPIPRDELRRMMSVYALDILDTPPEDRFDRLTKEATLIFHVPIATLTIVDANREWFKSCQGVTQKEGDRAISFCGHALVEDEILVVEDATKDKRFADNPLVVGEPHIRFYAGVPIMSADGQRIGVFCIKDTKPRKFSQEDKKVLEGLAYWVELEVNLRNLSMTVQEQQKIIDTYMGKSEKLGNKSYKVMDEEGKE